MAPACPSVGAFRVPTPPPPTTKQCLSCKLIAMGRRRRVWEEAIVIAFGIQHSEQTATYQRIAVPASRATPTRLTTSQPCPTSTHAATRFNAAFSLSKPPATYQTLGRNANGSGRLTPRIFVAPTDFRGLAAEMSCVDASPSAADTSFEGFSHQKNAELRLARRLP